MICRTIAVTMTPEPDFLDHRTGTVVIATKKPGEGVDSVRKVGILTALKLGKTVVTLDSDDSSEFAVIALDPEEENTF